MQYQAVLFDLDGTLIDSLADIALATNRTMEMHGFPPHPIEAYKHMIGDGVRKLILRALPADKREETSIIDRCIAAYASDYGKNWNIHTQLYSGIAEMLDGLVARGMRLAVLSNKPDPFTQTCAQCYLSKWQFDVVMGAGTQFPNKPDPASALEIARRLKLSPQQFLYLGDMAVDMETACNAGMTFLGAAWGFRTAEELRAVGAKHVINYPPELLTLL